MPKRPSDKNTKAEILKAFDDLMAEKEALESQAKQSPPAQVMTADPVKVFIKSEVGESKVASKPESLNQHKVQHTLDSLFKLQASFGSVVSELSEQLTSEALKLQDLNEDVEEEITELEELHDLEAAEITLDRLIQDYEQSAKSLQDELESRQTEWEQQAITASKTWTQEVQAYHRTLKARNEAYEKTHQRELETYEYDLERDRKLILDTYAQEQKAQQKALEDLQEHAEKQWNDRETNLAEREKQFEEAKAKVETFPKELEAAIKRAKEEGKGIANHQAKVKSDLLAKEVEGSRLFYELRLQSLQEGIQSQDTRLQSLSTQLTAALKQVQDLAVKAIEGASNINSLQAVKEIALEQAKTQAKNK
jgi:DNA repair exonuclease SbcCD ATPase subunit